MPKTQPKPETRKPVPATKMSARIAARRPVATAKPAKGAPKSEIACLCGCGEFPSGKGRFKPGHDARLYSRILRAERGKALAADPAITDEQRAWRESAHPTKSA